MSYIRTKNGILPVNITKTTEPIYVEHLGEVIGYWGYRKDGNYVMGEVLVNNFVKQADTIEELCDEIVILYKNQMPYLYGRDRRDTLLTAYNAKYLKENNGKLCGAIWTDKGLIYVAKMNDKGDLELV